MKKLILTLVAALGLAAGARTLPAAATIAWDKAPNKTNDLASLQNGAKLFVNYCLSCHSAAFMRFNRLRDIGLTEQQIKDNLLFTTEKVGETMKAAIDPKQAKDWFGANPPDLTVIARSRSGTVVRAPTTSTPSCALSTATKPRPPAGTTWFSRTWACPTCCGNCRVIAPNFRSAGKPRPDDQVFKGWEQVTPGVMTPLEYDQTIGDLVNYMQWMGEPAQNTRVRVGVWVLIFLGIFTVIAWRLNAAFWKDVK
jgi:ubiquinol-cytochrome c reductase cytochrome c1 subunit